MTLMCENLLLTPKCRRQKPFLQNPWQPEPLCAILHPETVEAEIKPVTSLQRARDAENRVRNSPANGPPRVRAKNVVLANKFECPAKNAVLFS